MEEEEEEEHMESQETHLSTASSQGHFIVHLAGTKRDDLTASDIIGNSINPNHEYDCYNVTMFTESQYCYSLMEAMPLPEPVWSTTEPSVMAEPPPPPSQSDSDSETPIVTEDSVDLAWGENQASSYSWWLGFLESLDDKVSGEKLNIVMEDSDMLSHECGFVGEIDSNNGK